MLPCSKTRYYRRENQVVRLERPLHVFKVVLHMELSKSIVPRMSLHVDLRCDARLRSRCLEVATLLDMLNNKSRIIDRDSSEKRAASHLPQQQQNNRMDAKDLG
jgi:hypothetical protein